MEISGDVTDVGQTNDKRRTREDRATQPNGCWMAEFRNLNDLQRLLKQLNIYESTFVLMKILDHLQRVPVYILDFTLFGAQ